MICLLVAQVKAENGGGTIGQEKLPRKKDDKTFINCLILQQ